MSKKKTSGGSTTMTLKDFHGGSIPSDLPLPSAPGVIARPSDRAGFDRLSSWGNPMGRADHRLRPGSAGSARNFDDKTPFLSHTAHIGRNFDEDERKPLDGVSAPRRTVSDESIRAQPVRTELKPDYSSSGRLSSRQVLTPMPQLTGGNASSYVARFTEATHVGLNSQSFGGNSSYSARFSEASHVGLNSQNIGGSSGQAVAGTHPNAWTVRKEAVVIADPVPAAGSGPNAALKLAHASALEKVSSGRWQSKQPIHHQTDIEVIRHPETESEFHTKGNDIFNKNMYNVMDVAGGMEYHDAALARHAEKSLAVDDGVRGGGRELLVHERARSHFYPETQERKPPIYADEAQMDLNDGKVGGLKFQSPVPPEPSERPKLKLHPKSKLLESLEPPSDYNQGYQQPGDSANVENASESYGTANPMKPVLAGSESGNQVVERPKLNLKPRSQPLEQLEGNIERERKMLFGGARPRELVLKERGIDDVAVNNHDLGQPPNRVIKQDVPRTETAPGHATPTRFSEKTANIPFDNKIGKNTDRQDQRLDVEKTDLQRRNWRSENWGSSRETQKQQQPQERMPSPETWRKPVEQQKTAPHDTPGLRYGKAASAVELAQAFSKSISDPKTADRFSVQRGLPGQGQIPFSRLTGPTPRPQINGY